MNFQILYLLFILGAALVVPIIYLTIFWLVFKFFLKRIVRTIKKEWYKN